MPNFEPQLPGEGEVNAWMNMPVSQKIEMIKTAMYYPALPLITIFRDRPGYRMMRSGSLLAITALLLWYGHYIGGPIGYIIMAFGAVSGALGYYWRINRRKALDRGEIWHTYSSGISWLERLPLPAFFGRERRVYRFLEPGFVLIVAALLAKIMAPFSIVLAVSAAGLRIFEDARYEAMIEGILNRNDSMATAMARQEDAGEAGEVTKLRTASTTGVAVGVAPAVLRNMAMYEAYSPPASSAMLP